MEAPKIDLPVAFLPELLSQNPKFAQLLESLSNQHITQAGITQSMQSDLDKSTALLEKERVHYLSSKLVVDELKNMIVDFELESSVSKSLTSGAGYGDEIIQIHQKIIQNEAKKQIATYNSSGNKLLGLSPEDIPSTGSMLVPKLVLTELCRRLALNLKNLEEFYEFQPSETAANGVAIHKEFVNEMTRKRQEWIYSKTALKTSFDSVDTLFLNYYNLLGKTLFLLVHLQHDDKLKSQVQQDQLQVKLLQTRAQTMIMKLSVLQHQIAADTYTPDSVQALNELKNQMQARFQNTQAQHQQNSKQLAQYAGLGQGFVGLVRQYVSIMDGIKDKKWTLDQLSSK